MRIEHVLRVKDLIDLLRAYDADMPVIVEGANNAWFGAEGVKSKKFDFSVNEEETEVEEYKVVLITSGE